jgi:hypothetical protein
MLLAMAAAAQSLEGALMPGPVIAGHAKLEADCGNCHALATAPPRSPVHGLPQAGGGGRACEAGFHGRIDATTCRRCRTDHKGREMKIAAFDERTFDHAKSDRQLAGARQGRVQGLPRARQAPRRSARPVRRLPPEDDTHRGAGCPLRRLPWRVELEGRGSTTRRPASRSPARTSRPKCRACHRDATFRSAPTTCVGCHRSDDKVHRGRLGDRCDTCHGVRDWKSTTFQHDRDTKYALKGRHRAVRCEACHASPGGREKAPSTCIGCHRADDKHQGSLGVACADCHVERGWKETRIDHDATAFPLLDKHRNVECKDCHRDTRSYRGTPVECVACHRKDDTHKERYGEKCATCHVGRGWRDNIFRHDRDAHLALAGKHATVIDTCHTGHCTATSSAPTAVPATAGRRA